MRQQLLRPIGRRSNREGPWRVKAMPLGQLVRSEIVTVVASLAQGKWHDGAIEQADDAAQRADPEEAAASPPAHRLRPGEAAKHWRDRLCDKAAGRDSVRRLVQDPVAAFLPDLLAARAMLPQEAGERLFRCGGARAAF